MPLRDRCNATARATVLFSYSAVCLGDCDVIGLATGDPVSAVFGFVDASVVPNALLDLGDVESFSATFGNVTFGFADLTSWWGELDASATAFHTFVALSIDPISEFEFGLGNEGFMVFIPTGGDDSDFAEGGPGALRRVPEPPTLTLLLACALVVCVLARHSRASLRRA